MFFFISTFRKLQSMSTNNYQMSMIKQEAIYSAVYIVSDKLRLANLLTEVGKRPWLDASGCLSSRWPWRL